MAKATKYEDVAKRLAPHPRLLRRFEKVMDNVKAVRGKVKAHEKAFGKPKTIKRSGTQFTTWKQDDWKVLVNRAGITLEVVEGLAMRDVWAAVTAYSAAFHTGQQKSK